MRSRAPESRASAAERHEPWGRTTRAYPRCRSRRPTRQIPARPRSAPRLSYGITVATAECVSSSSPAAGVVTTSTGPYRAANAVSSGVVSTTSPRKAVWMTRVAVGRSGGRTVSLPTGHHRPPDRPAARPPPGCTTSLDLQHGQERLLRDLDRADLLHALLALFLLLEELALARDVAAVALGE